MKLYGTDHSPFVARVQMAAEAMGIPLDLVAPPEDYAVLVPTGMVPALALRDGTVLPESEVIVEYLCDCAGERSIRPADAADRARARLLARLADLQLAEPLRALFEEAKREEAKHAAPGPDALAATVPRIRGALAAIDRYVDGAYAVGTRLSTADCALVPLLFFVSRCDPLARRHDGAGVFGASARVERYFAGVAADPIAQAALGRFAAVQARRAEERARTGENSVR